MLVAAGKLSRGAHFFEYSPKNNTSPAKIRSKERQGSNQTDITEGVPAHGIPTGHVGGPILFLFTFLIAFVVGGG